MRRLLLIALALSALGLLVRVPAITGAPLAVTTTATTPRVSLPLLAASQPSATPTSTATASPEPSATPTATSTQPPAAPEPSATSRPANCAPEYPTVCIPPPPPDLDCGDIPYRRFSVLAPDRHRFDADKNGIGCESG